MSIHAREDRLISLEFRDREGQPHRHPGRAGVILEGTAGYLVLVSYHSATAFDLEGKPIRSFRGSGGCAHHFANFLDAVRQQSCRLLHADIEEGHLSSSLAHAANASCRVGTSLPVGQLSRHLAQAAASAPARSCLHEAARWLARSTAEIGDTLLCGAVLTCDPVAERFTNNPPANELLTRSYRQPYTWPGDVVG
jgi:hypothetical protein